MQTEKTYVVEGPTGVRAAFPSVVALLETLFNESKSRAIGIPLKWYIDAVLGSA